MFWIIGGTGVIILSFIVTFILVQAYAFYLNLRFPLNRTGCKIPIDDYIFTWLGLIIGFGAAAGIPGLL